MLPMLLECLFGWIQEPTLNEIIGHSWKVIGHMTLLNKYDSVLYLVRTKK
jgi:hypothetical protein